MDKKINTVIIATWLATLILTVIIVKSCVKPQDTVKELDDSHFKRTEELIKQGQKSIMDSINSKLSNIKIENKTITINHQNLNNDLSKIHGYSNKRSLIDSLLKSAGYH